MDLILVFIGKAMGILFGVFLCITMIGASVINLFRK